MGRVLLVVAVLIAVGFIFKTPLKEALYEKVTNDMFVSADTDEFNPGIAIGELFPTINATYQEKKITDVSELGGNKGTVFVVSRSVVWCPFCMKQMAQLNENLEAFQQAGINVVGLTYDSPAEQQPFKDKFSIAYPLLSDNDASTVKILGILNEQYQPGENAYGIGHPGAFVINNDGVIVGKIFIEAYSARIDAAALLNYASGLLQ